MTKTENALLDQALGGIEDATTPARHQDVYAFLLIRRGGHMISIYGADLDAYQPQRCDQARIEVEAIGTTSAAITIRALDGEDIDELLDRAHNFVMLETPVPA